VGGRRDGWRGEVLVGGGMGGEVRTRGKYRFSSLVK